jgi:hypothetical protein
VSYESWRPQCAICKESVTLEESKTDERGQAVHENCYVELRNLRTSSERTWYPRSDRMSAEAT